MISPRAGIRSLIFLGLLTGFIAGCGEPPESRPKGIVFGEVKLDGGHLPDGQIIFLHDSGEIASANFGDDGLYRAQVAEGHNKVVVRSVEITKSDSTAQGPHRAVPMEIQTSRIPNHYSTAELSKIVIDVQDGENEFNVDLNSK